MLLLESPFHPGDNVRLTFFPYLTLLQPSPPLSMFWERSRIELDPDSDELASRRIDPQVAVPSEKSAEERWFLIKLDIFLLSFGLPLVRLH